MKKKSIPGAILGIIGGVFLMIGSAFLSICTGFIDGAFHTEGALTITVYLLGFGGAVVGIVGAILDFKNNVAGGILQAIGFVMALVLIFVMGFTVWIFIGMVLLLIGMILSFTVKKNIE